MNIRDVQKLQLLTITKFHQMVLDHRRIKVREITEHEIVHERVCHILNQDRHDKAVRAFDVAFAHVILDQKRVRLNIPNVLLAQFSAMNPSFCANYLL